MKRKIFLLFLILLFSVTLSAAPLQKLTVILDWFPNPDHAPLITAQLKGFFKEQGLQVQLIGPADPSDPPKLVAAGLGDVAITYEPEFMQQIDQQLPLIRFGTLIDKPLDCIVALEESGIKNISDLKGKRIGSGNSGLTSVMLNTILLKQGLTTKDIELINVRYNLTQALLAKKVDAVTGMMRNFEVPQLELNGHRVVTFFPEEYGVPNYSVLIFITHKSKTHDPRLPRFLTAVKKAVAYLDQHPQETWELFSKAYPESNNQVNKEAWFATLPYFAEDPASFDREDWENFARFMKNNHIIKKVQPISQYAVLLKTEQKHIT